MKLNPKLSFVLAICGMALVVGTFAHLMQSEDDFGAATIVIAPAVDPNDRELGKGPVRTETKPEADIVYRQTSFHADGVTPQVVKTVYANHVGRFLHPRGNFVLYQYHRADGTLEKEKLIEPEPSLGASVMVKVSLRFFDADGKTELGRRYFREDGTLAAVSDEVTNLYVQYRADGKTPRYEQRYDGKDYHATYFRPDGKTPWWTLNYGDWTGRVHFDRQGNPVEMRFTRKHVVKGFSMGSNDPPFLHYHDEYQRADGTLEYRQSWYQMWDASSGEFCSALGRVEVFAPDGKTLVRDIHFHLGNPRNTPSVKSDTDAGNMMDSNWLTGFGVPDLYGDDNDFVDK